MAYLTRNKLEKMLYYAYITGTEAPEMSEKEHKKRFEKFMSIIDDLSLEDRESVVVKEK